MNIKDKELLKDMTIIDIDDGVAIVVMTNDHKTTKPTNTSKETSNECPDGKQSS